MTTEQEIKQMADRLHVLRGIDNDTMRFFKERFGDFVVEDTEKIERLEDEIGDLEDIIQNAIRVLS